MLERCNFLKCILCWCAEDEQSKLVHPKREEQKDGVLLGSSEYFWRFCNSINEWA